MVGTLYKVETNYLQFNVALPTLQTDNLIDLPLYGIEITNKI